MGAILGSGKYRYEVVEGWGKPPQGWAYKDVAGVGVDARDNVYIFNRGGHPMVVFDKQGNFKQAWGEKTFSRPHGVTMAPDGTVWLTDDGDHTVRQCTLEGEVLKTLGTPNKPAPAFSGQPFNRPTHVAFGPDGDVYVSDGYGNSRVHCYSPDGKLKFSWGGPGVGPGEFNIIHAIVSDAQGYLYVADRESHRIQVFDAKGKLEDIWTCVHRPCGLYLDRKAGLFYVGELGTILAVNKAVPNIGPRVSILDMRGHVVARLGDKPEGEAPDQFIAPHDIAVDSRGDIYVGEVSWTHSGKPDRDLPCFRKLVRK